MGTLRNGNYIGRNVIKFRRRKNWTREELTAKMQLLGCYMTRDLLDSIETGRCPATEKQIMYFAEALGVQVKVLFTQNRPS
jgi:transcriptional regulator with XRE-family HTH domain